MAIYLMEGGNWVKGPELFSNMHLVFLMSHTPTLLGCHIGAIQFVHQLKKI